ncbi:MAG: hypothetical protein IIA45_03190 [Bacteroidetes bacterium]|nr:hypothetical protein [Bacteroidota bacterium]
MSENTDRLKSMESDKLIDVVKNYRQYGYKESLRDAAIRILDERGIDMEQLQLTGNLENRSYDLAEHLYATFGRNSKITSIVHAIALVLYICYPLIAHLHEILVLIVGLIMFLVTVLYFAFFIKSAMNLIQFYRAIGKEFSSEGAWVYFLLGMPFYAFMFIYFRNQMRDQMNMIR